mmetsp:Transcript_46363/g.69034  ORF Transcript_46363/g.69034 Transcript_46363/m.69034 type:complete len:176 (-) Transcript_46363:175-702(-)|eukprot:CAMPEP_0194048132 /NCGR_PEP_ID=MMETSP0009_2-20130614/26746_1 /TAXON_ID=210454 /ORGANISM="Grammatophora oceanica, Strain CCMP 410" /LENGTH=175 /DNA_ID=CAMNT_0038693945 /DNA_START=103 /DNA_END=630 /DNA_ORIENTATION=-
MADPENDFAGYMEGLAEAEAAAQEEKEILNAHELWRNSTWAGWTVRQIQTVGEHFRPFFLAVGASMKEDKGFSKRLLSHFLRISIVLAAIVTIYILAHILQMFIGKEIVINQEIVIVEEIPRSQAEKEGIVEGEHVVTDPVEMRELLAAYREAQKSEEGQEEEDGETTETKKKNE